jgi:hypothetical protein
MIIFLSSATIHPIRPAILFLVTASIFIPFGKLRLVFFIRPPVILEYSSSLLHDPSTPRFLILVH